jgi:putative ABC transport system permease protein
MSSALDILRDVRSAIKSLSGSPGFTLIGILTLGLGIGANTSMFSILSGYMLSPAPYPDSDRLARIYRATAQNSQGNVSPADYVDLKSEMSGYGEIAAWGNLDISLSEPGQPAETPFSLRISTNLFDALGTEPQLGRNFRPDEEVFGNHRVLILGHRYWQNRFAGDREIIGRTVRVSGEPHEVIGVLPATFSDWRHLGGVDVFRPLALNEREISDRSSTWLRLLGRRSNAVTRAQAETFVVQSGRRLAADFPGVHAQSTWRSVPILATLTPPSAPPILAMLLGLSGFVLLIACSNLANLLLARTMARAREFAVRGALGASRAQMLRPLIVESLLLSAAGGICAIFVALWTFDWIAAASAGDAGLGALFTLDWRVLSWAFGACLVTALAFGVAPALFTLRLDLNSTLKSGSRGIFGKHGHDRFRQILIVGQFALAMVLLAGAVNFARGIYELNNRRHGWESDFLVTGNILLPATTYRNGNEITRFHRLALERLHALPGVTSASISWSMPFLGSSEQRRYLVADREAPKPGQEPLALINGVSPRYFETVGTRVIAGRTFMETDTETSPKVFIISQAMARGLFGPENPVGRRIAQVGGETLEWGEIVGVVANVQSARPDPIPIAFQLYQPLAQEARSSNEIAVRTTGIAPSTLVENIRTTMTAVDPDLPVRRLQPAATTIARANYDLGVVASMLSSLALLGLGLSSLGIYGVITRAIAQRTGEFGIRLALGAQSEDITRLVLTSGTKLALIGSAMGMVGAFGVTRLISAAFPNMSTSNVLTLVGVTFLLVAVSQIAGYIPARYASKISPTKALRAE